MRFNKLSRRFKSAVLGTASTFAAPVAMASTSGGVFSPIGTQLNTVLTGISDFGGLVAAGGLISTGLAWWHGGEHKKAMMIGLGATVAGIVMANSKSLATSITGGATMGHVSTFGLLAGHMVHLAGI
ncbi:conjugal transfer protein TrbC [Acidithiobacillus thiooxidans]|uniref:TrbC/VirB2 family protein n=1 Tax=Acidithiobacillus thiooxidans TaxID=930 RepID=UPI001C07EDCF|nr:TrbC/VirB2 family protein [Acidithiobacillus thiooxidans]MBU2840293.1 conjugal transfer protein TrbC [Acidithiobacillus thiooxidans]MBU2844129.1 conjugal transfer protein TrbC [Acidithiobacillus thiooxidans]